MVETIQRGVGTLSWIAQEPRSDMPPDLPDAIRDCLLVVIPQVWGRVGAKLTFHGSADPASRPYFALQLAYRDGELDMVLHVSEVIEHARLRQRLQDAWHKLLDRATWN